MSFREIVRGTLRLCASDGALHRIALVVAATTVIGGALPALADACTVSTSASSQVFKQFGDQASYVLVPGGTFEGSTAGWSLNGASVVSGNESYYVNSTRDSHSLSISPNGVAASAPTCISLATPTFRFFARRTSGSWAQMNVNLLWTDSSGAQHTTTAGSIMGSTNWAATPPLSLGSTWLPLWQAGGTLAVSLQFLPAQYGGAWQIDDVYADPYSKGL